MAYNEYLEITLRVLLPVFCAVLVAFIAALLYACRLYKKKASSVQCLRHGSEPYFLAAPETFLPNQAPFISWVHKETPTSHCSVKPGRKSSKYISHTQESLQNEYATIYQPRTKKNNFYHLKVTGEEINSARSSLRSTHGPRTSPCRTPLPPVNFFKINPASATPVHVSGIRSQQKTSVRNSLCMANEGKQSQDWQVRNQLRNAINLSGRDAESVEILDVLALCRLHGMESASSSTKL